MKKDESTFKPDDEAKSAAVKTPAVEVDSTAILSESIPGGAYLGSDGQTWHDANGKPLTADQVKAAEAHADARQAASIAASQVMDEADQKRLNPLRKILGVK